jgi:hypothetical protein
VQVEGSQECINKSYTGVQTSEIGMGKGEWGVYPANKRSSIRLSVWALLGHPCLQLGSMPGEAVKELLAPSPKASSRTLQSDDTTSSCLQAHVETESFDMQCSRNTESVQACRDIYSVTPANTNFRECQLANQRLRVQHESFPEESYGYSDRTFSQIPDYFSNFHQRVVALNITERTRLVDLKARSFTELIRFQE